MHRVCFQLVSSEQKQGTSIAVSCVFFLFTTLLFVVRGKYLDSVPSSLCNLVKPIFLSLPMSLNLVVLLCGKYFFMTDHSEKTK